MVAFPDLPEALTEGDDEEDALKQAIDCLDEAITFGFAQKEWIENDSDLDSLRSNPRFQAILERLDVNRAAGT